MVHGKNNHQRNHKLSENKDFEKKIEKQMLDVIFALDTTGSMEPWINKAKNTISFIS